MTPPAADSTPPPAGGRPVHMLSFDVEEYFQVEAAARGGMTPRQWGDWPCRAEPCVDRILTLLDDHDASATFFVLGWIARHEPDIVRAIARAGHEIASHGMSHAMLHRLDPESFRAELLDSRKLLEDVSGCPVLGYRSPTFSISRNAGGGECTAWAIDVLAEAGFRYDSSIFPVRHDRYGWVGAPRFIHQAVGPAGGRIVEIPPTTLRTLGMTLPVGGGGYLRLLPAALPSLALSRAARAGQAGMIYLHPWEFDPDQPVTPMGRLSRWRHRVNLHKTEAKLLRLMRRHAFTSVSTWLAGPAAASSQEYRYVPSA